MQDTFDYIDGDVTTFVKEQLVSNIEHIVEELRDCQHFDDDIYGYLKEVVITVMNNETYSKIQDLLNKEKKNK